MSRAAYCDTCGQRFTSRTSAGICFTCHPCRGFDYDVQEIRAAAFEASVEAFWSGVRACMLIEARAAYKLEAFTARHAIKTGRELFDFDLLPFWQAVTALQLLGEVGGEV